MKIMFNRIKFSINIKHKETAHLGEQGDSRLNADIKLHHSKESDDGFKMGAMDPSFTINLL